MKDIKKVCKALNYFEHYLIFRSPVSDYVLISAFASLAGFLVDITTSPVGIKCVWNHSRN